MGSAAPTQKVESEPAAGLVVIDGDPGVVAGVTSELEHRYGRDYHVVGRLSARSGLAMLRRLDAHRPAEVWYGALAWIPSSRSTPGRSARPPQGSRVW